MKKVFLALLMLASFICMNATCGYCGGKGRVRTHIGTSGFGINNDKFQCPHCGKWVFKTEDHWDTCPQCHGDPGANDHHSSHNDNDDNAVSDPYIRYLSPDEYLDWKNCIDLAMRGGTKMVDCPACNADGRCRMCGGTGRSPFQHPDDMEFFGMPTPCPQCGTSGNCQTCYGSRKVSVPDESIKEVAKQRLEYYRDLVNERMQADAANNNVNINTDGYNQDPGTHDTDVDPDNPYKYDFDDIDDTPHSKSSNNMLIGIIAVAAVGVFIYFRRRR